MAVTRYNLTDSDWTDCGDAADCLLQNQTYSAALVDIASSKPATSARDGIRLAENRQDMPINAPGQKIWGRSFAGAATVVVVRPLSAIGGASAPMAVRQGALPDGTDRSGAITTGGTAQSLAPANANRTSLTGQNISAGDLWVNEIGGTAAVDTAGSFKVAAGGSFVVRTNRAISVIGATTGQKWSATET